MRPRINLAAALVVSLVPDAVADTRIQPGGADDTEQIVAACNASPVYLGAGVYHVKPDTINNCPAVIAVDTNHWFWYQGQNPLTSIVPIGSGTAIFTNNNKQSAIYIGFTVDCNSNGSHGWEIDSGFALTWQDVHIINCQDGWHVGSGLNQELNLRESRAMHNYGWGFSAPWSPGGASPSVSDSHFVGSDFSDNGKNSGGGINIFGAWGVNITGGSVQDNYGDGPGIQLTIGQNNRVENIKFDQNNQGDIVTGADATTIVGNSSTNVQPGAVGLHIQHGAQGTMSMGNTWGGVAYKVDKYYWNYQPAGLLCDRAASMVYADSTTETLLGGLVCTVAGKQPY